MPLWTIVELMHLTRDELCDLAARIILTLPELEAGNVARSNVTGMSFHVGSNHPLRA